jgi:hypothetical protein
MIWKTEDGDVAAIDRFSAKLRILPFCYWECENPDISSVAQAITNLQSCGALVTVDEDYGKVHARTCQVVFHNQPNVGGLSISTTGQSPPGASAQGSH